MESSLSYLLLFVELVQVSRNRGNVTNKSSEGMGPRRTQSRIVP